MPALDISSWPLLPLLLTVGCSTAVGSAPRSSVAASAVLPTTEPSVVPPIVVDEGVMLSVAQHSMGLLGGEVETWTRTPFSSQSIAIQALLALFPESPRSAERTRDAAAAMGVGVDQLRAFGAEHADAVARIRDEVDHEGVLAQMLEAPAARQQRERVARLPRGELDQALANIPTSEFDTLIAFVPSMAPPSGRLAGWHRTHDVDELRVRLERAASEGRGVAIYARAEWALPAKTMEDQVLDDATVRERLANELRIVIDLTDVDDDAMLADRLGLTAVPSLLLCPDAVDLAAMLDDPDRGMPSSAKIMQGLMTTTALLEQI